jgi:hypothetical protein
LLRVRVETLSESRGVHVVALGQDGYVWEGMRGEK